ncbi:HTH_Tnp_Tc3_2 domain-containing protein [Nephila pilipes]|uniref:HTH_Tnp_Tc3_2 domain-containing protein n=1 Tax=Nephila pilipes TaxID=299642 RepID=A0A8X6QCR6_NEPPI|nr:HTH_Tnp_Tc3_2 domain-containing protein [Nephila pilipes]
MSQRRHLTDSEAWRTVGRLEGAQTQAEVTGVAQSVISRIWNCFLETGSAGRRLGQDQRRATTPNEDRYLTLTARRLRNMCATLLQQHLGWVTGTTISTQTVRNRFHVVGLYARRPMPSLRDVDPSDSVIKSYSSLVLLNRDSVDKNFKSPKIVRF